MEKQLFTHCVYIILATANGCGGTNLGRAPAALVAEIRSDNFKYTNHRSSLAGIIILYKRQCNAPGQRGFFKPVPPTSWLIKGENTVGE